MTTQQKTPSTELATLDMDFGTNDEVVKPTKQLHPQLRYMTGNLQTTAFETAVGWYVPAGVNPALDEFLAARGTKRCIVEHKTGDEKEKPYWNLSASGEPISLIFIATGLKSKYQMSKNPEDRNGIAYGLGYVFESDGKTLVLDPDTDAPKKRVYLQARVYIHNLLNTDHPEEGFNDWFELSLTNFMVDALVEVLNKQFEVIDAFNGLAKQKGSPSRAQFWSFSIPTVLGQRKEAKNTNKKKEAETDGGKKNEERGNAFIYPMVAAIPDLTVNAQQTVAYLNEHRIPQTIQDIVRGGLLDETVAWSKQRSVEIVEGKRDQAHTTIITEEPVDATVVELAQLPAANDTRVTKEQEDWIRDTYCAGDQAVVKSICEYYTVQVLAQLKKSQYQALYDQFNS